MVYTSVEYRISAFAMFVDAGSVWDNGTDMKYRVSVGGGIQAGPVNLTLGIPLNTNELRAVFTMGIRFSGLGIGLLR
jgi:outer membrane translocation and assembly module TamA